MLPEMAQGLTAFFSGIIGNRISRRILGNKRISEDDDFRSRIIVAAKEKAKQFSIQRTVEKLVGRLEMLDNH